MMNHYNVSLRHLEYDIDRSSLHTVDKSVISELIKAASEYDIKHAEYNLDLNYLGTVKNIDNPPVVNCTDKTGHSWSDPLESPLIPGEEWNKGRRATLWGIPYDTDDKGNPVNPYMRTGIKGMGNFGRWGVNYTVLNGIVSINDSNRLCAAGIIRKDNNLPAFSGGFVDLREIHITPEERLAEFQHTQTNEFFEEMISGGIELLPAYQKIIDYKLNFKVNALKAVRCNKKVSEKEIEKYRIQIETEEKFHQVRENNPDFIKQLNKIFTEATPVYAGPLISSVRNTDNAWAETYFSWIEMNEFKWNALTLGTGIDGFKAGDDARDIFHNEITPDLVIAASGSNGPFMAFCLASYICNTELTPVVQSSLIKQCIELTEAFNRHNPKFDRLTSPDMSPMKNPFRNGLQA